MSVDKVRKGRRSRAESRQEILDRAVDFLWENPFREMSVARLMDQTTIGRSAFYVYFRDTGHLAQVLLEEVFGAIEEAIAPWLAGPDEDAPSALVRSIRGLVEVCVKKGPIVRAVSEATSVSAQLEQFWDDFMGRFDRAVEARLLAEHKAGRAASFNARATACALNRLNAAYLIHSFGRRPQADPDEVHRVLATIWVSTLYGREELNAMDL